MAPDSDLEMLEALPPQPVSAEAVKELGESAAVRGTMPIESSYNDLITEFLLISEETMHALAFDPEAEAWHLLESRQYGQDNAREIENELIGRLYEWREENVIPFLVDNNLIPAIRI